MNKNLSFSFKVTIPLFIGLMLVYFSVKNITPSEQINIKKSFFNADYIYILISILIGLISHVLRALRWKILINPLGYKLKLKNSIGSIFICFLANLGIPRSGEFLRASLINFYNDIPFDKTLGTILSERMIDLIILISLIIIGVINYPIINLSYEFSSTKTFLLIFIFVILFATIFYYFKGLIFESVKLFLNNVKQGIFSIFKIKRKSLFITYTFLIWTFYFLMLYISKFSLAETSNLSLEIIFISFVAGVIAMTLTNGGLGAYPLAITSVLVQYDVSFESAFAFGWIVWTSQTLLIIIFGSLSFIFLPILNK